MSEDKKEVKEIDLLELFSLLAKKTKSFFLSILKGILFLIDFGIKKIVWLIVFGIVGGTIGFIYTSVTPEVFTTNMIVKPNGIQAYELKEYLDDLSELCTQDDKTALANALGVDSVYIEDIKNIGAYYYVDVNLDGRGDYIDLEDEYDPMDTTINLIQNRLFIQYELLSQQPPAKLQDVLIHYINNNEYLVELNTIRKRELAEQISQTEIEIQKLDSLQNLEYFTEDNNQPVATQAGGYIIYTEKDKRLYYDNKLALYRSKQEMQKELDLIDGPVTIVKGVSELGVNENTMLITIIKFGLLFSIITYTFLFFRYISKQNKNLIF